jgi:hypothetical protein
MVHSTNGSNWVVSPQPNYVPYWLNDSYYANGIYVLDGAGNALWTSTDGVNWTSRSNPGGYDDLTSICYGNGTFLVRRYWSAGAMIVSKDNGVNWTYVSTGSFTYAPGTDGRHYNTLVFGNNFFLYPLYNAVRTSTDGLNWNTYSVSNIPSNFNMRNVTHFDNGLFIGSLQTSAGANSQTITTAYSSNGTTWQFNQSSISTAKTGFSSCGSVNGCLFVSCGGPQTEVWASTNLGVSWSKYAGPWDYTGNTHATFSSNSNSIVVATDKGLFSTSILPTFTGSTNSLIANLPLQGNTVDILNSNNNGAIIGSVVPTNNRFGIGNSAYYFNGNYTLSQIAASNPASFTKTSNDFTLSFWFQPMGNESLGLESTYGTSYSHSYLIAGVHGGDNSGISIGAGTNGISVMEHGSAYLPVVLSYPANLGTNWTHGVLTCSNNGAPVLYINGVYARTGLNSGRVKIASFYAGDSYQGIGGGGYGSYRGNVSDIKLFNRALSSNEVASLFNEQSLSLADGLLVYYPFQGNLNDYSSSSNNAINCGASFTTNRFGNPTGALRVGYNSGVLSTTDVGIQSGSDFTVSLWVKPFETPPFPAGSMATLFLSQDFTTAGRVAAFNYWAYNPANIVVDTGFAGASVTSQATNLVGSWNHLLYTHQGTNSNYAFYLNGVLQTQNFSQSGSINLQGAVLTISGVNGIGNTNGGGLPRGINGAISDVRIYNRALSSNEVSSLYTLENTPPQTVALPVLYVANFRGNILKGTLTNAATTPFSSIPASPFSIAANTNGILYAANPAKNAIYSIGTNGTATTLATTGLNLPYGLALDALGKLYAANFGKNSIVRIATNGAVTTYATKGVNKPYALAFDSASNLYVANQGNSTVVKISTNGTSTTLISGMALPTGVAVDSAGNLYAADKTRGTITRLPQGGYPAVFAYGLKQPTALALDAQGTLYAVNSGNNSVVKFSSNGISSVVTTNGLSMPLSLTIAPSY